VLIFKTVENAHIREENAHLAFFNIRMRIFS